MSSTLTRSQRRKARTIGLRVGQLLALTMFIIGVNMMIEFHNNPELWLSASGGAVTGVSLIWTVRLWI